MFNSRPVIFGCSGLRLKKDEREFFAKTSPLGFILFSRNCDNQEQLKKLTTELRETIHNENALILIDQEGGSVARLGPPDWRKPPPSKVFGDIAAIDIDRAVEAVNLSARLIGYELREVGINVNCAPVLDILYEDADSIVGDRAFSKNLEIITTLGQVLCDGLKQEGIIPVMKHLPGHGRAEADSHKELPIVTTDWTTLSQTDFLPFKKLKGVPLAMTAHIVYSDIDNILPATVSRKVIKEVIREEIGYTGMLMTDDLSMKALTGGLAERAESSIQAGCDIVLHCNGVLSEMNEISEVIDTVSDDTACRILRMCERFNSHSRFDPGLALKKLIELGVS